ncbi:hypothetical protein G7077_10425 [Sphingomonas piscis]|uniref:Uncharacterized protein n=1 Tax=Sphingomonas piscis TaxID=2714943 RepID=A0A6G7YR89_9SPHN|nr:hypothetical protein [Sphingomonas piscis]QIK79252.1 hypothetical protein G7077_10425 [Sphingomonas piscis]
MVDEVAYWCFWDPVLFGAMLDSRNLRSMADQCRTLASTRQTEEAMQALLRMADSYDRQARQRDRMLETFDA